MLNVSFLAVINALILLLELLKAAGLSQNSASFAGVERMTSRADPYTNFLQCGACHEGIPASASNFAFLISRMNIFLHSVESLLLVS